MLQRSQCQFVIEVSPPILRRRTNLQRIPENKFCRTRFFIFMRSLYRCVMRLKNCKNHRLEDPNEPPRYIGNVNTQRPLVWGFLHKEGYTTLFVLTVNYFQPDCRFVSCNHNRQQLTQTVYRHIFCFENSIADSVIFPTRFIFCRP